ncbi:MAG: adenosine-specific kinase [Anaerolineales bacterium]|jgi:adenosine/AMP kinase
MEAVEAVLVLKPQDVNVIIGQAHFIKTIEDLHEAVVTTAPGANFGVAFCESSGPALVRLSGNSQSMIELARTNALQVGAGHSFFIFLENAYPVNILNAVKAVPEVCQVFCATANAVSVLVVEAAGGRGIVGVIDGSSPRGVETEADAAERKSLLRRMGYKL